MSTRVLGYGALAALALVCAGCRISSFSMSVDDDHRRHRRVTRLHLPTTHICTHNCHDHYWDGGRVVVLSRHRHGPNCGHYWDGSYWLSGSSSRKARVHGSPKIVKVKHRHSAHCGCAYDGHSRKWIKVRKGHIHGPGCGHRHKNGRWTIRIH